MDGEVNRREPLQDAQSFIAIIEKADSLQAPKRLIKGDMGQEPDALYLQEIIIS